jgi:hypothetical protein
VIQYYDLNTSPATHDFCNWLARVEAHRRQQREPFVDIMFVLGDRKRSPRDKVYPYERKVWRVHNLLMPLTRCLPSVRYIGIAESGEQTLNYVNVGSPVVNPFLKAPAAAASIAAAYLKGKKKPISITLRQSEFEPTRNSSGDQWGQVCDWLSARGYTPIYVPDGEALQAGNAWVLDAETYTPAAMSPEIRLALYEQCVTNLMTTGGPMVLALMADVPLMAWKLIVPGIKCASPHHMKMSAMSPQDYWGPYKKLYWSPDRYEIVTKELEQWLPRMEERGIPITEDVFSLRDHELVHRNGEEKWTNLQAT